MQYKGYLARIEFDDEANIFHGEVINIRDVITFQGESVEKLKNAFVDSVEDYLKFCAARGVNQKGASRLVRSAPLVFC